ncbi:MAG: sulfatase-like hydrolase/transferase, partial [Candidatus Hydrogenedentes bacterium]|nr:sulfatase-like hydrolase/transferase [Candidatus Hydrogenedentota bacterium]
MALVASVAAPDVFFISVDTLRADHLGMYGYDRPTSPHLDALAAKSLLFENCVCE